MWSMGNLREFFFRFLDSHLDMGLSWCSPDPYILGAEKCGVEPARCLVVEDAPNGIRSGNAAGCRTLGLITTHSPQQVAEASPDFTVKDLSR